MKRFLRQREVSRVTGLARSTIYAMMLDGRFPTQIQIGGNRVAWTSDSIEKWQAEREAQSSKKAA